MAGCGADSSGYYVTNGYTCLNGAFTACEVAGPPACGCIDSVGSYCENGQVVPLKEAGETCSEDWQCNTSFGCRELAGKKVCTIRSGDLCTDTSGCPVCQQLGSAMKCAWPCALDADCETQEQYCYQSLCYTSPGGCGVPCPDPAAETQCVTTEDFKSVAICIPAAAE